MDNEFSAAQFILRQLGGSRFIAKTGAKIFAYNGDTLGMTLPKNASKANRLYITLNRSLDTYTMKFLKYSAPRYNKSNAFLDEKVKELEVLSDVSCDELQRLFTSVTGFVIGFVSGFLAQS